MCIQLSICMYTACYSLLTTSYIILYVLSTTCSLHHYTHNTNLYTYYTTSYTYIDGTTTSVLFTGELLKQAEQYTSEGLHPRLISEGYDIAKEMTLDFLEGYIIPQPNIYNDRELLTNVARTSLRTKLAVDIADNMATNLVDCMLVITTENTPIDLFMVEIMSMQHRSGSDSSFINGIVLDHGARHPDMPRELKNVRILTLNVSFEYEKTEATAGFYYTNAEEREKFVEGERKFTDEKVKQVRVYDNIVIDVFI